MTAIDRTPPAEPAQPIPAAPASGTAAVHPPALAWAHLVLSVISVVLGGVIGLTGPVELGIALVGAGLGGAGLRIIVNVRR
ncbi:hypothetical protein ACOZDF_25430 [Streptomyces griseoincarnatus]